MGRVAHWDAVFSLPVLGVMRLVFRVKHPTFKFSEFRARYRSALYCYMQQLHVYTTLCASLQAIIATMGGICFGNRAISRVCKSGCAILKLVCHFAFFVLPFPSHVAMPVFGCTAIQLSLLSLTAWFNTPLSYLLYVFLCVCSHRLVNCFIVTTCLKICAA